MTDLTYPAARAVAAKVRPHFARHLADAQQSGQTDLAPPPDGKAMEAVINAAFWASLRREEGYVPKISLALVPPEQVARPLIFQKPLPLAPQALARLGAAVERPGIHLGVWWERDELSVWGATRTIPTFCFVLEVVAPGLLVIKHSRGADSGKYVNVAVLQGEQIKVLDQEARALDCPAPLASLLGFDSLSPATDPFNVLIQLAVSMRAHGRGGSLLIVPANMQTWQESIVEPIPYGVSPPFSELADLLRGNHGEKRSRKWRESLRQAVHAIAGMTAVDGATVITDQYELLAFGAKIVRRKSWAQVEQVVVTEPVEGAVAEVVHPTQIGGTRHMSAAQFAQDQRDAIALVASQDGRFTVFAWSPCEEMVHAHSIEALLL